MKKITLILLGIFSFSQLWSQSNPSSSKPGGASKDAQLKPATKEGEKTSQKTDSKRRIIVQVNAGLMAAINKTTQFDAYRSSYNRYYSTDLKDGYQFKDNSRGQEFGFSIFYKVFNKMLINTAYYYSGHKFSDKAVFKNDYARESDFRIASHNYLFSFGFGNFKNNQARGVTFDLNYFYRTERIYNYYMYPNAGTSIGPDRNYNGVYKGVRNGLGIGITGYLPIYRRLGTYLKISWIPENLSSNNLEGRSLKDTWTEKSGSYWHLPQNVEEHLSGNSVLKPAPEDRVTNSAGSISITFGLSFNIIR